MRAAIVSLLAAAALAACAAPTHIEGHAIRAVAGYADDQSALADGLHQGAPAWFEDWWRAYLRHARGGHAVLALDRNGRGGWYVYCATAGCHRLTHPFTRSVRDVHYTRRGAGALPRTRRRGRPRRPARLRPLCDPEQDRLAGPPALGGGPRSRAVRSGRRVRRRLGRHDRRPCGARHARILALGRNDPLTPGPGGPRISRRRGRRGG